MLSEAWARLERLIALAYRRWARRRAVLGTDAVLRAAKSTMRRKRYCVVATRGDDGIDARVLQPFPPTSDLTVWFGTSPTSRKAQQVSRENVATLVYEDDARAACVVLVGRMAVVADVEE